LLATWQGEFGGQRAAERYRQFVEQELQEPFRSPFADAIDGWILASQEFAKRIRQQLQPARQRPQNKPRRGCLDVSDLLAAVCDSLTPESPPIDSLALA
jgi:hypothetical protein